MKNTSYFRWDPEVNKVYIRPTQLEAFIRSFLSYEWTSDRFSNSLNDNSKSSACNATSDCGSCPGGILSYSNVKMECLVGKCICPAAFYHLALDIG